MKKKPAIMEVLSIIILSAIVWSFLVLLDNIKIILELNTYQFRDFLILFVSSIIFSLQVYLGFLFKKQKKEFPIYFIVILLISILFEGIFYLIESTQVLEVRLLFDVFYMIVFSFYLFGSKEAKSVFAH